MTTFDMEIDLKSQQVQIRKLNITMQLQQTRTGHLGLNIAFDPAIGERTPGEVGPDLPRVRSEQEDMLVYFADGARLSLLHQQFLRQVEELQFSNVAAGQQLSLADRGVRAADNRVRSLAEGLQNSVHR